MQQFQVENTNKFELVQLESPLPINIDMSQLFPRDSIVYLAKTVIVLI